LLQGGLETTIILCLKTPPFLLLIARRKAFVASLSNKTDRSPNATKWWIQLNRFKAVYLMCACTKETQQYLKRWNRKKLIWAFIFQLGIPVEITFIVAAW